MGTTIATPVTALEEVTDDFVSSYRSSLGQVVGYFRCKGVPREEAADMANETMTRLLVHLKRHGRDRTDLGPLARTIARNLLIERVRRAPVVLVPLGDDVDVPDDALEPADHVLASERQEAVREAVRSLSPRHRHVVGMWMEGRTPAEIARALGVKRNAVDAILHRARRSLASKLDGGGVLGLVAIVGLRLRVIGRRIAGTVGSIDPSGQAAPAAMTLATMGLAAVLTLTGPAHSAAGRPAGTSARVVQDVITQGSSKAAERVASARAEAPTVRAPVAEPKEYEMDVVSAPVRDPLTGEAGESRITITYEPHEGMATPLDPLFEAAIKGCVSSGYCSEGQ